MKTCPVILSIAATLGILANVSDAQTEVRRVETRYLDASGQAIAADAEFAAGESTFILIHGFRSSGRSSLCLDQAQALRNRFSQANIMIVDWQLSKPPRVETKARGSLFSAVLRSGGGGSLLSEYRQAVDIAPEVARRVAEWMKTHDLSPSNTVICGHSLGAQIAAFVSDETARAELFGARISAIIAADPAGPIFERRPENNRLDPTDAGKVIVVHTTDFLGDERTVGTTDIYVHWPEEGGPDVITRHSLAMQLVTDSLRTPTMTNSDGTPFGFNAVDFGFTDNQPRTFEVAQIGDSAEPATPRS